MMSDDDVFDIVKDLRYDGKAYESDYFTCLNTDSSGSYLSYEAIAFKQGEKSYKEKPTYTLILSSSSNTKKSVYGKEFICYSGLLYDDVYGYNDGFGQDWYNKFGDLEVIIAGSHTFQLNDLNDDIFVDIDCSKIVDLLYERYYAE